MEETKIFLKNEDCAIVIRQGGECELVIPNQNLESDEVSQTEILVAALGMFLRDPVFVEMIKTEFIKQVQNTMINDNEEKNEVSD